MRLRRRTLAAAAIVVAGLLAAPGAKGINPAPPQMPGVSGVLLPEPTTAGNWDGTWYFNSVDSRMALWMRTRRAKTELRLKYESGLAPVVFETDWSGEASYHAFEKPATFRCKLTKVGPDRLEGTWFWEYQFRSLARSERGTFTLFRALDGRTLVFQFTDYELTEQRGGRTGRSETLPLWTFGKGSKYLALWDELPF